MFKRVDNMAKGLYKLPPLKYGYEDLAPYISEEQLRLHHAISHIKRKNFSYFVEFVFIFTVVFQKMMNIRFCSLTRSFPCKVIFKFSTKYPQITYKISMLGA